MNDFRGFSNVRLLTGAVQTVLTEPAASNFHPRYNCSPVGIAMIKANVESAKDQGLSPLDIGSLSRLDRHYSNQDAHPLPWEIADVEQYHEALGGAPAYGIGRFSAFALAKLNEILETYSTTSHSEKGPFSGPGRFANAGGIRTEGELTAVSGLWEVHDHALARVIEQTKDVAIQRRLVELSVRAIFNQIKGLHRQSGGADELSRNYVGLMLEEVDQIVAENLPIAA